MKSSKNKYQIVIVFDPKLIEKDRVVLEDKLTAEIEKEGMKVKGKKELGSKDLAYQIDKKDTGMFVTFEVKGKVGFKSSGLNVFLNRQTEIIRFLILKV